MIRKAEVSTVRCAIYTRKSTDEGLDSDFNSLDAQREAAEAYVASQKAEGWVCLAERYDDGGYSGGTTERPALKRLLADVEAGGVDCIVVYKVDRLSRSLLDFAKLMDRFNQLGVAFVSITQNFSTADAVGRLTLHMLMSFAEFERSMISERTRDKVCAARRKGKFTGSTPPLGYDIAPEGGRLVVNADEAERVGAIFDLYLRRGTLIRTVAELNRRGWTTKAWTSKKGRTIGGLPFVSTNLHALLTNATLAGLVRFHGELYPGEHEAVVAPEVWHAVQRRLKENGRGRSARAGRGNALLRGLLVCAVCQKPMIHVCTSARGNRRYQYYRCESAIKRGVAACPSGSLPAAEVERYVVDELGAIGRDEAVIAETARQARELADAEIHRLEGERAGLEKALRALGDQIREVATAPPSGENTVHLSDLQARVAETHERMGQIGQELEQARAAHLDEADLRQALGDFDGLWSDMSPDQRTGTLHALVERVAYDGQGETISLVFRPTGIRALAGEPR